MKTAEVRELATEELHQHIAELKEELFNLRFQLATGQLDNHRRIRQVKREVAQIRTILRERDFAFVASTGPATPAPEPEVEPEVEPEPAGAEAAPEPGTDDAPTEERD